MQLRNRHFSYSYWGGIQHQNGSTVEKSPAFLGQGCHLIMPFSAWGGSWALGKVGKSLAGSQSGTQGTLCFFLITDLRVPLDGALFGEGKEGLWAARGMWSPELQAIGQTYLPDRLAGPFVLIRQRLSCLFCAPGNRAAHPVVPRDHMCSSGPQGT